MSSPKSGQEIKPPRLSIIMPCFNGMPFVKIVLSQMLTFIDPRDELVISDGKSSDGTSEYLAGLNRNPSVSVYSPSDSHMSMSDHWDWLSNHATGQWQFFLGQDDVLRPDYSEVLDSLISFAEEEGVRSIVGKRSFLNWPSNYDLGSTLASRGTGLRIRSTRWGTVRAFTSLTSYHSLPQMYTSCVVSKSLVDEIRNRQQGKLIVAHPQDASIAASIAELEKRYLFSLRSFSWVGTSDKSAGWAIASVANSKSSGANIPNRNLAAEYSKRVASSHMEYPGWAGPFELGENAVYFWQATVVVRQRMGRNPGNLRKRWFVLLVLVGCFLRDVPFSQRTRARQTRLIELGQINGLHRTAVWLLANLVTLTSFALLRVWRVARMLFSINRSRVSLNSDGPSSANEPEAAGALFLHRAQAPYFRRGQAS